MIRRFRRRPCLLVARPPFHPDISFQSSLLTRLSTVKIAFNKGLDLCAAEAHNLSSIIQLPYDAVL